MALNPAFAAASKRSRNGNSVKRKLKFAAKRGIVCDLDCVVINPLAPRERMLDPARIR